MYLYLISRKTQLLYDSIITYCLYLPLIYMDLLHLI